MDWQQLVSVLLRGKPVLHTTTIDGILCISVQYTLCSRTRLLLTLLPYKCALSKLRSTRLSSVARNYQYLIDYLTLPFKMLAVFWNPHLTTKSVYPKLILITKNTSHRVIWSEWYHCKGCPKKAQKVLCFFSLHNCSSVKSYYIKEIVNTYSFY